MSLNIEIIVYYISGNEKEFCIQELKMYHKLIPGFIEVILHFDEGTMSIIDLHSARPGNGYGTHLIVHACKEAAKRGITKVTLDDCSDMYNRVDNIYKKVGMKYEDEDGGPEMFGNVNEIAEYKTSSEVPVIYSLVL